MTAHSLFPSFVRASYHSPDGAHKMTIPTGLWSPGGGTNGSGTFLAWDLTDRDAEDMIFDLVNLLTALFPANVTFDDYTIFSFDSEDASPTPRFSNGIGLDGTVESPGWSKAVQTTISFYDTAFNIVKLVLLDSDSGNNFSKHTAASLSAAELAVGVNFSLITNAWASRANLRPATLLSVTQTLNEKLRRQYRET